MDLNTALHALSDRVQVLRKQLGPVMRPVATAVSPEKSDSSRANSVASDLTLALRSNEALANTVANELQEIMALLEV